MVIGEAEDGAADVREGGEQSLNRLGGDVKPGEDSDTRWGTASADVFGFEG